MSDPFLYDYPSPLEGYENQPPLPDELNEDGKSFKNPQTGVLSPSYEKFTSGVTNGQRGGFDIHIYYHHGSEFQREFARALWERIRREFPELRWATVVCASFDITWGFADFSASAEYTDSGIILSGLIP